MKLERSMWELTLSKCELSSGKVKFIYRSTTIQQKSSLQSRQAARIHCCGLAVAASLWSFIKILILLHKFVVDALLDFPWNLAMDGALSVSQEGFAIASRENGYEMFLGFEWYQLICG